MIHPKTYLNLICTNYPEVYTELISFWYKDTYALVPWINLHMRSTTSYSIDSPQRCSDRTIFGIRYGTGTFCDSSFGANNTKFSYMILIEYLKVHEMNSIVEFQLVSDKFIR